jgi:MOSC domain-containing protein YiiM
MKIRHIYISAGHNFFGRHQQPPGTHPEIEVAEAECIAGKGIRGDRFFDFKKDYKGQITFFAFEVYEALCRELNTHDKPPSVFRRNVITESVDLNSLVGREFDVQGVRFLGTTECSPCEWMDVAFGPGALKFLHGRGGLRAKILSDGFLRSEARNAANTAEIAAR